MGHLAFNMIMPPINVHDIKVLTTVGNIPVGIRLFFQIGVSVDVIPTISCQCGNQKVDKQLTTTVGHTLSIGKDFMGNSLPLVLN